MPGNASQTRACRTAKTAAAARDSTPIFAIACWTSLPAVRSLIDSASAISRSVNPSATRRKTSDHAEQRGATPE